MSTLLDSLANLAAPTVSQIAQRLGENDATVSRGLRTSLASVLAGLVTRTKDPTSIRQVFDLVSGRPSSVSLAGDMQRLVSGITVGGTTAGPAGTLLSTLFGSRTAAVGDLVTRTVGFRNASSGSSLLNLAAPMVLAYLGQKVRDNGLNAGGLSSMLLDERESVLAAAPPGLVNLVDSSGFIQRVDAREAMRTLAATGGRPVRANGPTSGRWVWPIVGVAAAALVWFVVERGRAPVVGPLAGTSAAVMDSAAARGTADVTQAGGALGAFVKRRLPGGVELSIPEHGTEAKLIGFIEDRARPVNDTTWFDFDRLSFATGSARLLPESQEQLENIVSVLKAYPRVNVKVGGYTDNVGGASTNMRLSQRRADAVRDALVAKGIPEGRLKAEGYGEKHPVADNSTEEGRARNRRIALRVTKK